jgi:hypothetical protein
MVGPLSGYLLASPDDAPIGRRSLDLHSPKRKGVPYLAFESAMAGLRHWEQYIFHSDRPFRDDVLQQGKGPYQYPVFCARSGSKLIVLTELKRLTEYLIEAVLNKAIFPNLKHVNFRIEKMIADFQKEESPYRTTSLHGSFSGPDFAVRRIILYGSEVTNSIVFRECQHLFNFYRCGVAERTEDSRFFSGEHDEIAKLGGDGSLSILSFGRQRAIELNRIVNYLIVNKWVDDWVVPWRKEDDHDG